MFLNKTHVGYLHHWKKITHANLEVVGTTFQHINYRGPISQRNTN